ncbi:MAG TPA: hypothetical protein VFK62_01085 [Gaiellaceae bacterium]|nr:hypothetical protein [Gaiellaceae bacterium]
MDERFGSVRLSDSAAVGDGTLVATLERAEVEKALQSDEPVDLLLDVERVAADGTGRETERIALGWEPEDLERLLAQGGGEITLTFDEAELRQLLDADVDAHGMRERLAVVTVVAGLAVAGAGSAAAMVGGTAQDGAAGTQAAVTHVTASEVSTGLTAAAAGPSQAELRADAVRGEALNQQYGLGTGPTAAELQADTARGEALNQQYGLGTAPAAPSEISTGVVPQAAPITPEVTAGVASQPTATPASSDPSWTSPSPETLAIAAGAILAIAALGFAARSQRPGPRPA